MYPFLILLYYVVCQTVLEKCKFSGKSENDAKRGGGRVNKNAS